MRNGKVSFDFVVYVSQLSEEQADEIAGRWPETTSGARAGQEYVGFTREADSLGEAIDRAIADLRTVGISPWKVEADCPPETATV
jgi:hypothetical protein